MNLTVLIAAGYPRPWRLRALLTALATQRRKPEQIIVCDDTGLDASPFVESVAEFAGKLASLSIVQTRIPAGINGVSVARNMGARVATGDALLLLDDDSLPVPSCCEVHMAIHEGHADMPLAVLGQRTGEYQVMRGHPPYGALSDKAHNEITGPLGWGNFISNNLSIRRELFLGLGGFCERFCQPGEYGWEDIELGIRWFGAGYKLACTTDAVVYHPDHKRDAAKQQACDRAYLRLVATHPEKFVRAGA